MSALQPRKNGSSKPTTSELPVFDRLARLPTLIAGQLVRVRSEDFDTFIGSALKHVANAIGVDRASVSWCEDGKDRFRVAYSYVANGDPPLAADISASAHQQLIESFDAHELMPFEFRNQSGESALCIPLVFRGKVIGLMTMDSPRKLQALLRNSREQLQAVANIFSCAMKVQSGEIALEGALEDIVQLRRRLEVENRHRKESDRNQIVEMIGQTPCFLEALELADRVAPTDSVVLIQGETGTGKELLARRIHALSRRASRPMLTVNCAALPATLIESELFGREKGAYTGALTRQIGRFEAANNSSIFLDEIGELLPEVQVKFLRVLEEGTFERLGSTKTTEVDIRIIVATNQSLLELVDRGDFRPDLFYRINVFPIVIPPLRERREDIHLMAWSFVQEFGQAMGRFVEKISDRSLEDLLEYDWPGNVRQLRNVIERAMILGGGPVLDVTVPREPAEHLRVTGSQTLRDLQREHILEVLEKTGWRIRGRSGAAEILGEKASTLESRMKRLGIQRRV